MEGVNEGMKRVILSSSKPKKSFEYKGYTIYDTGFGYAVYRGKDKVTPTEFVEEEEAKSFIDSLVKQD